MRGGGSVAGGEPGIRDLAGHLEPDRVVPQTAKLRPVEEDAVDYERGILRSGLPRHLDRGVARDVPGGGHEPRASAEAERLDQHAAKQVVVERVSIEAFGRVRALHVAFGARSVEPVDGCPEHRMPVATQSFGQGIREVGLARTVDTVDREKGASLAVVVQELVGERVEHVTLERCEGGHAPSLDLPV